MQRVLGLAIATFAFSSLSGGPAVATVSGSISSAEFDQVGRRAAPIDIAALLTAAKGAPPIICSLAALIPAYFAARLDPVKALRYE